jgi:hypothetical protein
MEEEEALMIMIYIQGNMKIEGSQGCMKMEDGGIAGLKMVIGSVMMLMMM